MISIEILWYHGKTKFYNKDELLTWAKEWEDICNKLKNTNKDLSNIVITKRETC